MIEIGNMYTDRNGRKWEIVYKTTKRNNMRWLGVCEDDTNYGATAWFTEKGRREGYSSSSDNNLIVPQRISSVGI